MGDWGNAALQAAFWTYANSLRREAKLCDIVLYVQGRKGAMVGYPAHKLLLISASKYFKLLFEREDLRNSCHFPHLSEDGLFTVLDIVYGHEVSDSVNIDDALMAARFLQVDCAVEALEQKRVSLAQKSSSGLAGIIGSGAKHRARERDSDSSSNHPAKMQKLDTSSPSSSQNTDRIVKPAGVRVFRNTKAAQDQHDRDSDHGSTNQPQLYNQDTTFSQHTDYSEGDNQDDSNTGMDNLEDVKVKMEPDVDLTDDVEEQEPGFSQLGFGSGNAFAGQSFDNQGDQSGMFQGDMGDYTQDYEDGQGGMGTGGLISMIVCIDRVTTVCFQKELQCSFWCILKYTL